MYRLTIFTATYNRAHLLPRLYYSLQKQKKNDFEWLVIDDGSTDETSSLFEVWLAEHNRFHIRYYRQKNQGLISALNRGVELSNGEYFAKIDSDDYLTDDYSDYVFDWLDTISDNKYVYAVAGLRINQNGVPLKGKLPHIPFGSYRDATDLERKKYDLDADMCEAWRTSVLKKYPFPLWPGEKFAPEQLSFYAIAIDGLMIRWYPIGIQICEYQEGGLTKSSNKLVKDNPMGYAMMYNQYMLIYKSFSQKCKAAMNMTALCFYGRHMEYLKESNDRLATLITFPLGLLIGVRRILQYKKL